MMAQCWEGCLRLRRGRDENLRCFPERGNISRKEICYGLDQRKSLEYRNSARGVSSIVTFSPISSIMIVNTVNIIVTVNTVSSTKVKSTVNTVSNTKMKSTVNTVSNTKMKSTVSTVSCAKMKSTVSTATTIEYDFEEAIRV